MKHRKKLLLAVIILAGCAFSMLLTRASAQTESQETPGQAELKKGDYDGAIKLLTSQLANRPNDETAATLVVRVYIETGRYAEAEAAARKFLAKSPTAGTVRHELGEILMVTGRYADAITEYATS